MNKVLKQDVKIMEFLQNNLQSDFLDKIMPKISATANAGIVWILIACIMGLSGKYKNTSKILIKALLISTFVCNVVLKPFVGRIRPFVALDSVESKIKEPKDPSFPSGHTMASFVAAMVIFCTNPILGVIAFGLAFFIAISRLYLLVHYPSDVIIASWLGAVIGVFSIFRFGKDD
ncbi:MAG: phosphatase PAP2 family protein [Clostridiales bacterium]|nr:phosphatase PAP2 family protein [Clostridiales bacterium]